MVVHPARYTTIPANRGGQRRHLGHTHTVHDKEPPSRCDAAHTAQRQWLSQTGSGSGTDSSWTWIIAGHDADAEASLRDCPKAPRGPGGRTSCCAGLRPVAGHDQDLSPRSWSPMGICRLGSSAQSCRTAQSRYTTQRPRILIQIRRLSRQAVHTVQTSASEHGCSALFSFRQPLTRCILPSPGAPARDGMEIAACHRDDSARDSVWAVEDRRRTQSRHLPHLVASRGAGRRAGGRAGM
ncbi:hypothetical protein CTRI78_v005853 [Colletotrichum trifolii]|uniref:Uncharacterized protein n=1 Tax=Colletotrichum trifolii TaxID=5466 RepID=A0A4R8RDR1_COLTR|nr:hypothetical protein CTRI78_v005853 [Colletotrichum trifolii]